ncbi:hypothetical protein CVIRNUC_002088 [Coccomyxa viridis]|uniref:Tryptophan-rich sensory protein n=1 Tax=Coccomyxa viridis TaxID=1274662 RepID=A0AAV1HY20_9CHLO|nr:hypothetical protein CVIRNUC_002088 [Coccomyxa viridis]
MPRWHDPADHGHGLLAALPRPDWQLAAAGAVVFGLQRLVPAYEDSYRTWYPRLRKPSWNPPNWMFPAIWIPLKIMQSAALWLIWKSAPANDKMPVALPIGIFLAHALLGNQWNVVFFGERNLTGSLKWMGAFWLSVAGTIASFNAIEPAAAALMVPTQIWVTVAAKLNWDIVQLNTADKQL